MNSQSAVPANPLGYESILKLMWRFSIPSIISFLVNSLYNMVDQVFIGQGIGELAMAATNVSFPLITICTGTALLLGVGGASNLSLNLGRRRYEDASLSAGNALALMVYGGVTISVLSIVLLNPMLRAFGSTDPIMPYAVPYTRLTAIGFPFMVFSSGAAQIIRADGSPRYSMASVIAGAVFNLIFDPVFLFVFGMGIEGIALATVLGQILSTGIVLYYILRKFKSVPLKKEHLKLSSAAIKPVCALGAAACVNQLAMTVVQIVKNNVLRHYGALSVYGSEIPQAAVGAITKVTIAFLSIVLGISQGCQPIIGFNYGAKNYDRVRRTIKYALISTTAASLISFAAYQLFPRQIMGIFGTGSDEYYDFAVKYLRIFMLMTFVNGIQPTVTYFFTSIGKASWGMWMSMTRQLILLVPLLVILPVFWGMNGVMYAGPLSDGAAAILAALLIAHEIRRLPRETDLQ